ncbi:hypothetical protein Metal_1576 [Methylomicrobium album BG8]|uniref:Uncharacterized protein n=2 Tax=Methylococcaceae TaxID=403 RepID=H8GLJ1_METAL|nr:hypothetical protein Metal_1576 [Methylomicrobium album BG8]
MYMEGVVGNDGVFHTVNSGFKTRENYLKTKTLLWDGAPSHQPLPPNAVSGQNNAYRQTISQTEFTDKQAELYRQAVAARRQQGDIFEAGASRRMLKSDSNKAPLLEDARVPENFLNGSPADVAQFLKSMQNKPQALRAAEDYLSTQLRNRIYTPSGDLKAKWQQEWLKWQQAHQPVLRQFPELNERITTALKMQNSASKTAGVLDSGGARHFLAEKDPDRSVKSLLQSPNKQQDVSGLLTLARDPAQRQNLAGAIKDHWLSNVTQNGATDILGNPVFNRGQVLKSIKDPANAGLLRGLLDNEGLSRLNTIAKDLERSDYLNYAPRARGSDTNANLGNRAFVGRATDTGLEKIFGRSYGLLKSCSPRVWG